MFTANAQVEMAMFTCKGCGIIFGVPAAYAKVRQGADILCPNGHEQSNGIHTESVLRDMNTYLSSERIRLGRALKRASEKLQLAKAKKLHRAKA